jgi:AcrR family transcriptional regulator
MAARKASRTNNPRGEGGRLREEILAAAAGLIEDTGNEQAVTLRAVARRVGIAAPSIYPHFASREAIVDAVVDEEFAAFDALIAAARRDAATPAEDLRRGCRAYLRFAAEHPNRYRVLFGRIRHLPGTEADAGARAGRRRVFEQLIDALRDCADTGWSSSEDPTADALTLWLALHGYAMLRGSLPDFPWPDTDLVLERILTDCGHLLADNSHLDPADRPT